MIKRFYVYEHVRTDTGKVFYVGKGTYTPRGKFARSVETCDRSVFWTRIVKRAGGFRPRIVAVCADEALAFRLERALIAAHGRRIDGGLLCNLTLGGEGHAGLSPSEATREKLRQKNGGRNHVNWGKRLSAETCARKSAAMKASPKSNRGKSASPETRERIRVAKYGARNPMFGRVGQRHPTARLVRDADTGESYGSVKIAARVRGMVYQTLYNMLSGHRPNPTTLRFA